MAILLPDQIEIFKYTNKEGGQWLTPEPWNRYLPTAYLKINPEKKVYVFGGIRIYSMLINHTSKLFRWDVMNGMTGEYNTKHLVIDAMLGDTGGRNEILL